MFSYYETCAFFKIGCLDLKYLLNLYNLRKTKEEAQATSVASNIRQFGCTNSFQRPDIKEKIVKTNLERYGVTNARKLEVTKEKYKQTCLLKYGVENVHQAEFVKEKTRKTNIDRYGGPAPLSSEHIKAKAKKTCMERYNTPWMGRNHSYHHIDDKFDSKDEECLYDLLVSVYGKNNVGVHVYSDFFEKEIDFVVADKGYADYDKVLYIEYHGWYGHGPEPYDPNSKKHQEILNNWRAKGYTSYINNWLYRDPELLEIAKWHKLRFKAIYRKDFIEIKRNNLAKQEFIKSLKEL